MKTIVIAMMMSSAAITAEPNVPFPIAPPADAPPVLWWYVAEPGQTIFWPVNVWTRYGSEVAVDVSNADPNGPIWDFAVERVSKQPIDPNNPDYGWNEEFQAAWTVPDSEGVYYVRVTAGINPKPQYGEHDLRPTPALSDSRTWVIKAESYAPPQLWVIDPPLLTVANRNWQSLYASASKSGGLKPSRPVVKADGTQRKAPQVFE